MDDFLQEQSELGPKRFTPEPSQGDPNWLPPVDGKYPSPRSLKVNMNALELAQLEDMAKNYKLTPATLAFHLENLRIPEDSPLKWFPAPFLMHISLKIAIGIARGNARICISAPPRHGKSKLSTIHGPLWILENFSDKNVVVTTYGADLSEDFSRQVRDFIKDNPDQLEVRIRKDADRNAKFLTNKHGALTAIGLGGPITGRGADVLFIDDYIKQIKEANSPTYRQYVWDWFTTTAMTRLEPNASVIVIATRWHHDDLIGRIMKFFPDEWDFIKYHARARKDDPLGREVGEALFPQRYSSETLDSRKRLLGAFYYDALFDQEPHENTSDLTNKEWIIKKSRSEIEEKTTYRLVRVWDFAGTENQQSDYTAGGLYIGDMETQEMGCLNMKRGKWSAAKIEGLVKSTAEDDGPNVEVAICQETGSAGKAVVSHYQTTVIPDRRVTGYYWNTGKVVVAHQWLAACENGLFWILDDEVEDSPILDLQGWNQYFINEFGSFPSEGAGYNDDMMDTAANAHIHLFGKKLMSATFGRKKAVSASDVVKKLPVDPAAVQKILQEKGKTSPHLLMRVGKILSQGGSIQGRSATFGRDRDQQQRNDPNSTRERRMGFIRLK